ncbi:MAG: 3-phytase [Actinomycetota bacterium]|nr:3-phytase [Actinomycetota bacterium]
MTLSRDARRRTARGVVVASAAVAAVLGSVGSLSPAAVAHERHGHATRLAFRGEAALPAGATFAGTTVGGLSSITYDRRRDVYYALSDDQVGARFYTLRIDVADGALQPGDVTVLGVTTLRGPDGQPFPAGSLDPEGLALTKRRTLIVTTEGFALPGKQIAPFIREFNLDGSPIRDFAVPSAFEPVVDSHGVRNNLGLESAAVTPDGRSLFTGGENALVQDGPAASLTSGSRSRLLRYDVRSGQLQRQYVYDNAPVVKPPSPAGAFTVSGLVELLPFDRLRLLSMERSFSVGAGNSIKLYDVSLYGATDVGPVDDLQAVPGLRPVRKRLAFDLATLGLTLDNLEGMTLGPRLRGGKRALVIASDNNFMPGQVSQFLLFSVEAGRGHRD